MFFFFNLKHFSHCGFESVLRGPKKWIMLGSEYLPFDSISGNSFKRKKDFSRWYPLEYFNERTYAAGHSSFPERLHAIDLILELYFRPF